MLVPVAGTQPGLYVWERGAASVFGGGEIFRVLLYCYSLLAMSNVSVTEYTNIVVIDHFPNVFIKYAY